MVINSKTDYSFINKNNNLFRYLKEENETITKSVFTKEYIRDILITAIEGGSNWVLFDTKHLPIELQKDPHKPLSIKITSAILNYHKRIPVYDYESSDEDYTNTHRDLEELGYDKLGYLGIDDILDAINILKRNPKYASVYNRIINDTYDANDADIFLQLAVMGRVIFG